MAKQSGEKPLTPSAPRNPPVNIQGPRCEICEVGLPGERRRRRGWRNGMLVGGVAASMIILLAGSAALAADVSPGDGSAPSQQTQGATQAPAAPGSGCARRMGRQRFPFLSALPADYFATTPYLLGEWPGIRSKLSDLGIQVSLTGVDEAVMNLSGGLRQNAQEAGQVALQAQFDLQKSLGLTGASVPHDAGRVAGAATPLRTQASPRFSSSTKSMGAAISSGSSNWPGIKNCSTTGSSSRSAASPSATSFSASPATSSI